MSSYLFLTPLHLGEQSVSRALLIGRQEPRLTVEAEAMQVQQVEGYRLAEYRLEQASSARVKVKQQRSYERISRFQEQCKKSAGQGKNRVWLWVDMWSWSVETSECTRWRNDEMLKEWGYKESKHQSYGSENEEKDRS